MLWIEDNVHVWLHAIHHPQPNLTTAPGGGGGNAAAVRHTRGPQGDWSLPHAGPAAAVHAAAAATAPTCCICCCNHLLLLLQPPAAAFSASAVRSAKFIARKQWMVCGADDMQLRVYNYNTMDKVKTFEAHTDYIRSVRWWWGVGGVGNGPGGGMGHSHNIHPYIAILKSTTGFSSCSTAA
jgi:hypothetical protein